MRILVIKTGALGDVLRSSFIAQALKDKYGAGKTEIYWVTDEKAKPLLHNNPYVNHVLTSQERKKIERENFDIAINLEEDEENSKWVTRINAKKLVGFIWQDNSVRPTATAKEWFDMSALGAKPKNDILKKQNKKTHRQIISEIIGADSKKYEPFLRMNTRQRKIAENFIRRYRLSRSDLIVGINLGSAERWPKGLPIDKSVKLINEIYKRLGAKILLFGGANESERNKELMKKSKAPIIDTGCGNDLFEFPAIISVCNFFITADTLGLHVALALKRKTIALIGPTSPSEIEMYGIGEKVIADSNCVCCYKKDCKSMNKIDIDKIINTLKKMTKEKITLLITAFKEPTTDKAIEAAINQDTNKEYNIIVSAPDEETLDIARKFQKKHKNIEIFKDPGKGKSYALNILFKKLDSDILILTDGDVAISKNSVKDILEIFNDPEVGCLTGRPSAFETKSTKYGYWANFLFEAAHRIRKKAYEKNEFIECSGYLFAFRKKLIESIPLDVAEDSVIPYYFWEKGYKIGYAENALVYIKNASNFKDWIKQKTRTSKAHETLEKYVDTETTPRVKNFKNEAGGIVWAITYPDNIREIFWTIQLIMARLYMWGKVMYETHIKKENYGDAWVRIESAR